MQSPTVENVCTRTGHSEDLGRNDVLEQGLESLAQKAPSTQAFAAELTSQ